MAYIQSFNNVIMTDETDIRDNVFYGLLNTDNVIYSDKQLSIPFTSSSLFPSYPKIIVHEGHIFGKGVYVSPESVNTGLDLNGCDLQFCNLNNISFVGNMLYNIVINSYTYFFDCTFDMSSNQYIRDASNQFYTSDELFGSYPLIIISNGHIVGPYKEFPGVDIGTLLANNIDLRNFKFVGNTFD